MSPTDEKSGSNSDFQKTESKRLKALYQYNILDTLQEEGFDSIAKLASKICDTPVSLINLIDQHRQWTKSSIGIDIQEIPREDGVCQYTILEDDPVEISDLTKDDRFQDKYYAFDGDQYTYYAGAPLITPDGHNIGALCVMDTQKHQLNPWQLESLKILADEVIARLELRLKQKQLEESNRHKDEILHIVSHDMRNPLTGILGITGLIRTEGYEDEEELNYLLDLVDHSARKLLENVNDLLDQAQIKSGGITLEPELADLEEITKDVIEMQGPSARVKNVELNMELTHSNGNVVLDATRFRQILGNLINNAVKFTPEGGKIDIFVDYPVVVDEQKNVQLRVRDDGIGIPEEHQNTLFTKEQNYRRQGTKGEKSTGMGLPLLKKLVEAYRGSITLNSEPDKGSEFTVLLPELSRIE